MLATIGLIVAIYTIFRYVERVLEFGSSKVHWATTLTLAIAALIATVLTLLCVGDLLVAASVPLPPPYP